MQKEQEGLEKISNDSIMELYIDGLKIVNKIVNSFAFKYRIIDKEELKSHLVEKLVLVIKKFKPDKGIKFKYFAIPSLQGYGWNFIRDHGRIVRVPRKYSELYMKYSSLNRKNNYQLSIPDAAILMDVDETLLRAALEAANTRFCEITNFNETIECDKSYNAAVLHMKSIPKDVYDLLEEIYLDNIPEEKAFLNKGLTPNQGRRLLLPYLAKIHELK